MLVEKSVSLAVGSVMANGIQMTVSSNNSKLFGFLSNNIYSKTFHAIMRELISNGIDASKMLPKEEQKPVVVFVPNTVQQDLYIQDFGIGMSIETVMEVFTSYLKSTKENDENQIGGFGLGSKTPFLYVKDAGFKVETTSPDDGVRRTFVFKMLKQANGDVLPSYEYVEEFDILNSSIKGTKISFAVKDSKDLHHFVVACEEILLSDYPIEFKGYCENDEYQPIFDFAREIKERLNASSLMPTSVLNIKTTNGTKDFNLKNNMFANTHIDGILNASSNQVANFKISLLTGGITYPYTLALKEQNSEKFLKKINEFKLFYQLFKTHQSSLHFFILRNDKNGYIELNASRESVRDTEINNERILELLLNTIEKEKIFLFKQIIENYALPPLNIWDYKSKKLHHLYKMPKIFFKNKTYADFAKSVCMEKAYFAKQKEILGKLEKFEQNINNFKVINSIRFDVTNLLDTDSQVNFENIQKVIVFKNHDLIKALDKHPAVLSNKIDLSKFFKHIKILNTTWHSLFKCKNFLFVLDNGNIDLLKNKNKNIDFCEFDFKDAIKEFENKIETKKVNKPSSNDVNLHLNFAKRMKDESNQTEENVLLPKSYEIKDVGNMTDLDKVYLLIAKMLNINYESTLFINKQTQAIESIKENDYWQNMKESQIIKKYSQTNYPSEMFACGHAPYQNDSKELMKQLIKAVFLNGFNSHNTTKSVIDHQYHNFEMKKNLSELKNVNVESFLFSNKNNQFSLTLRNETVQKLREIVIPAKNFFSNKMYQLFINDLTQKMNLNKLCQEIYSNDAQSYANLKNKLAKHNIHFEYEKLNGINKKHFIMTQENLNLISLLNSFINNGFVAKALLNKENFKLNINFSKFENLNHFQKNVDDCANNFFKNKNENMMQTIQFPYNLFIQFLNSQEQ